MNQLVTGFAQLGDSNVFMNKNNNAIKLLVIEGCPKVRKRKLLVLKNTNKPKEKRK